MKDNQIYLRRRVHIDIQQFAQVLKSYDRYHQIPANFRGCRADSEDLCYRSFDTEVNWGEQNIKIEFNDEWGFGIFIKDTDLKHTLKICYLKRNDTLTLKCTGSIQMGAKIYKKFENNIKEELDYYNKQDKVWNDEQVVDKFVDLC